MVVVVALVVAAPSWATAAERPNVVVVQTDDQTLADMAALPEVRRLIGEQGVTFADYHASFSLCCPSRASLLTGQYAHTTGVEGNVPPKGSVTAFDDRRTLPVWLKRAGYRTAHVGKYLNLYTTGIPPGWDEWYTGVDPTTYRYFGFTLNENGVPRTYGSRPEDYSTDVFTDKAVDVVRRNAGRPFFLALDYVAPHTQVAQVPRVIPGSPPVPAPRHAGRFADLPLPRDPSFDEEDVSDKPTHVQRRPRLSAETIDEITTLFRARRASLLAVDEGVARVIAALRETGVLDRTYVFFVSDNGFMAGQHRYPEGKLRFYEPSTHLPLLVRGPGVARGATIRASAMTIDLAPTIAELTGARPDLEPDGVSLAPVLRAPRTRWNRYLLHEYVAPDGPLSSLDPDASDNAEPSFRGVRSSDGYVYVEHDSGERELYDLGRDPHQLDNRAADAAYETTRARLATALAQLRDCRGAGCRAVGPPMPGAEIEAVGRRTVRVRCLLPRTCRGVVRLSAAGRPRRALASREVRVAARAVRSFRLRVGPKGRRAPEVLASFDLGADGRATRVARR